MTGGGSALSAAAKWIRKRLRGRYWANVGFSTVGDVGIRSVRASQLARLLERTDRRRFVGETFVYVVRRSPRDG